VPTIHELTRTVDSWTYQRECDLTEIHRLRTTLDSREKEITELKQELNSLKDVKKQMLTEINRMGFATVQADSEFRQKQEQLKEEQANLAKEINKLEQTKQSLQSDLSEKKQTLSTYSAITDEILGEWKKHSDKTLACIAEAAGTVPVVEKYGFLVQISGHHVLFAAFAPTSYEELRGTDGLVREVAKRLANSVDTVNCRREVFVVVPDECMMYLTKCLYASPLCSVQVITPSQVVAAVRTVARFVVYEKTQVQ
jgi:chromosome segregation ATPase